MKHDAYVYEMWRAYAQPLQIKTGEISGVNL